MHYSAELLPAKVFQEAGLSDFTPEKRHWQGIASMDKTANGRLFVTFYSGGKGEGNGNYSVLVSSDDDGANWVDPLVVVRHEDPQMRVYDPNVWIDPKGRLWFTWAQSHNLFDGRAGVWAIVCNCPDNDELKFSKPRRIANGIMMNKPTVLKDGTWLFPCAVWNYRGVTPSEVHEEMAQERLSNVYVSVDEGESFVWRGGANVPNRSFDEHMVIEKRDGSLWMLVRRNDGIGQSLSYDGGYTWWEEGHSGITGPDSRFFIRRLTSGNLLLVNHVDFRGRNNLMAKLSFDDGKTWHGGLMLDDRDNISYPDGTQDAEGVIYITYDRERNEDGEILFCKFTEEDILAGECKSNRCSLGNLISRVRD